MSQASTQLSPTGRFEKVMVASDGSEFSAGAERVAIAMAKKGGAHLTIMSAVISSPELDDMGPDVVAQAEAAAEANLNRIEAAALAAGIECTKVLRYGDDPYREILAESEDSNIDAIIIGRRGKRGLARLMLGDATAKVVGNAKCSVMVVPKAAEMWTRRVLLATDGSRSSDAAAMAAARIAHCCATPITILSVEVPHHSPERQAEARKVVDRVLAFYQAEGLDAEGLVGRGLPDQVIAQTMQDKGCDLVVMGSHGRTGLGRLLLGSNSERVIGQATCPVLCVRGA
ncbi:universal stress protein [Magnetospirillum moscoviense]|uniref:UspA domain-containing protein n=1 Tax=Magnetospirillum moscoviense TaxID=1437059 RepID=A0A178MYN9_9PROT|nr:universal stress protein [Magnetospirillum moscoviense]OAN63239.1 hypothetical protein A6A05_06740 [Magnetospirillum moscoviense]